MKQLILLFTCLCQLAAMRGQADSALMRQHVSVLVNTKGYRNYTNTRALDSVASYIKITMARYADTVFFQPYVVHGKTYRNVVARFEGGGASLIVVGAHYDVCEDQPGADDNASGVAGLLELARLLSAQKYKHAVELVAYTLEEPPHFRTPAMGSYVHAASLAARKEPVAGMISLEMIGYFKDAKGTQDYPIGALRLLYGSRGNYITLVKKYGAGKFVRRFNRNFVRSGHIRTKKFAGPRFLPGVDFSDHLNYWKFGYRALMITDTAFYRNKNYHEAGDTISTLDFARMAKVIDATLSALLSL